MKIKYLIMDVDGTLTDGKIYMGNSGELFKAFNVKDGCGIHDVLLPTGIIPVIITGRTSIISENRCKEIGIKELHQGVHNKIEKLDEILERNDYDCSYENVAYIGDDINDLSCMLSIKNAGGLVGCPADATERIRKISDFICKNGGGNGAVREFIEWVVEK